MTGGFAVLGGVHRGRRLETPPGRSVRPTAARVRKALFDLVAHSPRLDAALPGAAVLDLFAGSGALGIEALSRGAASATFVERDPRAARAIEANLGSLGLASRARVVRVDALRLPPGESPHGLCLVDAPYGKGLVAPALERAAEAGWLAPEARAAAETGRDEGTGAPEGFRVVEERVHGRSRLSLLRRLP